MPAFKRVSITGPNFYETIVKPNLGDLVPDANFMSGAMGEFTVLDDVADSRKIVDIKPIGNILERRDASCKIVYKSVGEANVRRISTTELYGATQFCRQEFYQGCLKDWRNGDPVFQTKILEFFRKAIARDMVSNMYFGDVARVEAANAVWSTNKFDGVFTQWKKYIAAGDISGDQTFNIPAGDMTPANAKIYLQELYDRRDDFSRLLLPGELAFTIDQAWAEAYEEYLIQTGSQNSEAANYVQDGVKIRAYKGIPIMVNKFFNPVLKQITGQESHFGTLTLRGNYMFATDKNYGEGPNGDQALIVWYDWEEMTWKYVNFLKAGTGIILPENASLALPA